MNAIIYCRVSSDEQAKGCSLDYQEQTIKEYCRKNNYNVIGKAYRDDASGKDFKHRPKINEVMKYCKANKSKIDLILVLRWNRYSRDVTEAYANLDWFKNLNIEVNAIEEYIDWSKSESKLMLAMYLSMAEVDNDKRSKATKDGIHQSLKMGKCTNKAPRGYKNKKEDDYNKSVEIDKTKAPIVQWVFSEVAKGTQTPNYIRKLVERKYGWKINKNSFMDMLRNHFYIGEIFVPEYNNEPAQYVEGLHEGIINKEIFEKVQNIVNGRKKNTPKLSKKINPDLFLRKYIHCPVCGSALTGSGSTGNGGTYPYYHCSNDGKHFRYRADKANELFNKYLSKIKPNEVVLKLYNEVLLNIKKDDSLGRNIQIEAFEVELSKVQKRIDSLEDKFIDGDLDKTSYENNKLRYNKEMNIINEKINLLKNLNRSNIEPKLKYAIALINNMDSYVSKEKIEVKCKLISSMFPDKIVFDGNSYRTNSYNSVLDLIHKETNELKGKEKRENPNFMNFPASVPRAGNFYFIRNLCFHRRKQLYIGFL